MAEQQGPLGQGQNDPFYNDMKWRGISERFLKKHPMCEHCKAKGRYYAAEVTDHIIELEDNWDLRYTKSNFQALCRPCHNKKTAKARKERLHGKTLSPSDVINWAIQKQNNNKGTL
ncbi:HNH endonuclease [Aeromonas hydrophila]|uniref:HNH endonuclease n=1 Tax=Aeromonas hydrophila TaxID=644 RepID=UPI003D1C7D60